MVFYYKDIETKTRLDDFLILFLIVIIFALPFLIYYKKYKYALIGSIILALVQLIAYIKNGIKYPL